MKYLLFLFTLFFVTNSLSSEVAPFSNYSKKGLDSDFIDGKNMIAEGKVGCLLIAGGQGSRLRFSAPKGFFPITLIKQKSLYQLFAEKVVAAGKQVGQKLQLAIMTSSDQLDNTIQFFQDHGNFGLEEGQFHFFAQDNHPFLDDEGLTFLGPNGEIASGPDGNAASIKHFYERGIWQRWKELGIEYVTYQHIDNPLADPFDAELVGFHFRHGDDLIIKCIERENPLEKLGVVLLKDGKLEVIEYTEISDGVREAKDLTGRLIYPCGNLSLFSFSMDFIQEIAMKHYEDLVYHKAWKEVDSLIGKRMAWKYEKFIFDILHFTDKVHALLYPREECFAPLKNAEGSDSVSDVQRALLARDIQIFEELTGHHPTGKIFELDPQFYYPTENMFIEWNGRALPSCEYIVP